MTLEQRMDRLERQIRWYRKITLAMVLVAVAAVSMGQTADYEDITCRSLRVINQQGQAVAALASWEYGGTLSTFSPAGKERVRMGANTDGNGMLATFSPAGKELVRMGATTDGDGSLTTYSAAGNAGVILQGGSMDDTGGYLAIKNKTGETIVQLYADDYGNGVVGAWNRKGEGRTLTPGP